MKKLKTKIRLNTISIILLGLSLLLHCCQTHAEPSRTLPIVITQQSYARDYKVHVLESLGNGKAKARYKIAIIDTGYDPEYAAVPLKICKTGNYDFYSESSVVASTVSHGTLVGSIIAAPLRDVDYCAVIYQVVDKDGGISPESLARAVMMAAKEHVNAVNISITGQNASFLEQRALTTLAKSGARIFVAAGNERRNMNEACQSFPACYPIEHLYMVGALTDDLQQPAQYSNRGARVKSWYSGSYYDGVNHAEGTSFASPRACADFIFSLSSSLPTH